MELGLTDRTVIVTGATGGIGRRIAHGFAQEGADVVITYRESEQEAERLGKEIGDRARAVRYDLADPASAQQVVDAALAWTGRVDVLVNNAVAWGATDPTGQTRFEDVPDGAWDADVRANVEGAVRLSRAVAPVLRQRRFGRLVHVSSSLATDGLAGTEYYAAAKAALHGFSRSVAFSLGRDGDILSNVVCPGLTRTDTNPSIVAAAGEHYARQAPIGRLLDADEVAGAIMYLGSAANTGITGQVITVTGGA